MKGNWLVSAGQDYSIRLWERTEELLELQDEREEERRQQEEEEEENTMQAGQEKHVEGETKESQAVRASRPTYRTEEAIDRILAAIDMYRQTLEEPDAPPHYLLLTHNVKDPLICFKKVLHTIRTR